MNMQVQPKYRPSLTLSQMQRIVSLLNPTLYDEDRIIQRILRTLILKAEENLVSPSHVAVPKKELEDSLGLSQYSNVVGEELWKHYRNGLPLSPKQRLDALGYAFNNDLLTPQEESQYTQLLLENPPK